MNSAFLFVKNAFHAVIAVIVTIPLALTMWIPDMPGTEIVPNENATNPHINEYLDTDVSAHRSGAGIVPENTMMAFEYVLENQDKLGVDTFEFDVQITADGELILLHNLTYDETTNAKEEFGRPLNYASSLTFEEASVLNFGENFCDENGEYPYRGLRGDDIPYNLRVVKCEDVIDYIEDNSNGEYKYIIEIKSLGSNGKRAADKLYTILTERNLEERAIWATSKPDVANYMEKTYPDMPRSADPIEAIQFYIYCRMNWNLDDVAPSYIALQIPYGDNALYNFCNLGTKQVTNYAHKYDIAVQYWTINEPEEAQILIENGADCIMSDYPQMVFDAVNGGTK